MLTWGNRPSPFRDQEHRQQRVLGPAYSHHLICNNLLLSRPHSPMSARLQTETHRGAAT